MMRWTTLVLGALLALALAYQPAQAVVIDLPIIDTKGDPLPGYTFTFRWPNGKTSSLTTDSTGRLHGDVPKGAAFCSLWSEGLHMASGLCDLTGRPDSKGSAVKKTAMNDKSRTSGKQEVSQNGHSIAPPPTSSERAASAAVDRADSITGNKIKDQALRGLARSGSKAEPWNYMVLLSGSKLGSNEFGVVVAQLFGLDGSGGDGGAGGGGGD